MNGCATVGSTGQKSAALRAKTRLKFDMYVQSAELRQARGALGNELSAGVESQHEAERLRASGAATKGHSTLELHPMR